MVRVTGKTRESGFQFGIRRTMNVSPEVAWNFLLSSGGITIWLGENIEIPPPGIPFKTSKGIHGKLRLISDGSHLRMDWKKQSWNNTSLLQVRIIGRGKKTTIAFHQDKLLDEHQRAEMKDYWNEVIH